MPLSLLECTGWALTIMNYVAPNANSDRFRDP